MDIMILKNLWQKYKIIFIVSTLFFVSLFLKLDNVTNISSMSITCLSIIFGFAFSFILGIYTQERINVFMNDKGILDSFIIDNKAYLLEMLSAIVLIFILSVLKYSYTFYLITISTDNFIVSITIFEILKTMDFIKHYFMVYKNTYCDRVRNFHKKDYDD